MNKLLAQAAGNTLQLTPGGGGSSSNFSNLSGISFGTILSGAISLVLIVAAIIFFFMLVIGGVKWILSGGDKGQTESARNQITAALVGLVIVFAAWAIANLVGGLFGVGNIFNGQITLPKFY